MNADLRAADFFSRYIIFSCNISSSSLRFLTLTKASDCIAGSIDGITFYLSCYSSLSSRISDLSSFILFDC